jgi:hypothetical protein
MYVVDGFQLPKNVICLNGPGPDKRVLVNVEPPSLPKYPFPERPVDGILLNLEQEYVDGFEEEFSSYLKEHGRDHVRIVPIRYRLLFLPFMRFLNPKEFMVRSLGGELVTVKTGS